MIKNEIKKIGLLDSGVGGLSVLARLYEKMPDKDYLFYGDTKNVPYGTKTPKQILSYTTKILEFFITKGVDSVAIACNTTSALAYEDLKEKFKNELKIFPLIQTAAPSAVEGLSNDDTIVVFATYATVNSHKYKEEIQKINPKINVVECDCTGFVEIVENRLYNEQSSIDLIKSKLEIAKEKNAKRIILGCTHYPYLVNIFKRYFDTDYFDPAISLAKLIKSKTETINKKANCEFYVSKDPENFKLSAKMFFDVENIELVEL